MYEGQIEDHQNYIQNLTKIRSVTTEIYSTYNGMAYISRKNVAWKMLPGLLAHGPDFVRLIGARVRRSSGRCSGGCLLAMT